MHRKCNIKICNILQFRIINFSSDNLIKCFVKLFNFLQRYFICTPNNIFV